MLEGNSTFGQFVDKLEAMKYLVVSGLLFLVQLPQQPPPRKLVFWAKFARKVDLPGNIIMLPALVCLLLALQ